MSLARGAMALVIAVGLTGCGATKMMLWSWGIPGVGERGKVVDVTKRGRFLDAELDVAGQRYRFLFPAGFKCTQIVSKGAEVSYTAAQLLPAVQNAEGRCDAVGIMSLREWMATHRRQMTPATETREVTFQKVYEDDEVAFVQGRFHFAHPVVLRRSLGGGLGRSATIGKSTDVIAVLPKTPECQTQLAEGKATAEFHPDEGAPYRLVSDDQADVCPVLGIAQIRGAPRPIGAGRIPNE